MIDGFLKISDLRTIYEKRAKLEAEEFVLAAPILTDFKYIPIIYDWFCELSGCNKDFKSKKDGDHKREFLFIILFLYSPKALAGSKMKRGLRKILSNLLGLASPTGISNMLTSILVMYDNYKEHRMNVDYFYTEIMKRLKEAGIVP